MFVRFKTIIFQSATAGVYKRVWENNIKSMDNVFVTDDYKAALKRVQEEDFVILGEVMTLRYFLEEDHSCKTVLSTDRFFKSHIGIAVRKNFPNTKMFNQRFVIDGSSNVSH